MNQPTTLALRSLAYLLWYQAFNIAPTSGIRPDLLRERQKYSFP